MTPAFANPNVHVQSWYVAALSSEVKRGHAVSRPLLGRRIALFRGDDGRVRALDARCAHLGADLGQGRVVGDRLRCVFHQWTYDGSGRCVRVPSRDEVPPFARVDSYPVEERDGAIFLFNGPAPSFPLPRFEAFAHSELRVLRLPPRRLRCHPHLAVANGLDVEHYRTVHRLDFVRPPVVDEPDPFRVRIRLELRLRREGFAARCLRLLAGDTFTATFVTWGGSMATIEGWAGRTPILVLFTHRADEAGASASQTFVFRPRRTRAASRAALPTLAVVQVLLAYVLSGDRSVLEGLQFRDGLVEADAPLAAFMRQVNAMPAYPDQE